MRPSTALVALLATAILTAAPAASAQPGVAAPIAPPSSVEGPPPPRTPLPKARPGAYRPAAAFFLTLGATTGWIAAAENGAFGGNRAVAVATLAVAPAAGRWYVGQLGVIGMGLRAGGTLLFIAGVEHGEGDGTKILAGGALLLTGVFYDLVGAPAAAMRQNQRRWAATPTALASPRGTLTPGLAVAGAF